MLIVKVMKILAVLIFVVAFSSVAHAGDFSTPELDPSIVGSASLLICGTTLMIRARRLKK